MHSRGCTYCIIFEPLDPSFMIKSKCRLAAPNRDNKPWNPIMMLVRVIFILNLCQSKAFVYWYSHPFAALFYYIHVLYICFVRVTANRTVILALGCWITALAHAGEVICCATCVLLQLPPRKRTISPVCACGGKGSDDQGFIISLRRRRQRRVTANQRHEHLVNPLPINRRALLETAE